MLPVVLGNSLLRLCDALPVAFGNFTSGSLISCGVYLVRYLYRLDWENKPLTCFGIPEASEALHIIRLTRTFI